MEKQRKTRRKSVRISDRVEIINPHPRSPKAERPKIIPMRQLEGMVKYVTALEKTRRLVTTQYMRGYITERIHLSTHYTVFEIDTGKGRWFFYLLQNDREYDMIRENNDLYLECWDYEREGMEGYIFIKSLVEDRVEASDYD